MIDRLRTLVKLRIMREQRAQRLLDTRLAALRECEAEQRRCETEREQVGESLAALRQHIADLGARNMLTAQDIADYNLRRLHADNLHMYWEAKTIEAEGARLDAQDAWDEARMGYMRARRERERAEQMLKRLMDEHARRQEINFEEDAAEIWRPLLRGPQ
ncbi:hypothetical protein SAMN06265795_11425 [Noviherbaspirillum humi]|uniref:Uncharacterized protein n=1 Tax=Noviherbaspirillum humi TaxID=1688639 RepID=A0A239JXL8_9BURK|nr:hypothetical protein [Noviherbaspirillum humi]SNT10510.1 hypothetical protein SAMN06265795_11425 [Noviherbaspirillum humi]